MADLRDRIALLVRLSMPPAVQQRIASDRASWAALTAGTHEPEPDASEMVRNRSIVDEDADRLYGDGVQHNSEHGTEPPRMSTDFPGQPFGRGDTISYGGTLTVDGEPVGRVVNEANVRREAERQAFLRRVQYVDPRERRA